MKKRSQKTTLRFLRRINKLVASASFAPHERAEEIDFLLRFGEKHGSMNATAFKDYVSRVIAIYRKENPNVTIAHWNLLGRHYDPLFLRGELIDFLKPYATEKNLLVIVTGLAESISPRISIRSVHVRDRYQEAQNYLQILIAKRIPRTTKLSLLFV